MATNNWTWINVNDKLPELEDPAQQTVKCLVTIKYDSGTPFVMQCDFDGKEFVEWNDDVCRFVPLDHVTHWMLMPGSTFLFCNGTGIYNNLPATRFAHCLVRAAYRGRFFVTVAKFNGDRFVVWDPYWDEEQNLPNVTHWMYLPDPAQ